MFVSWIVLKKIEDLNTQSKKQLDYPFFNCVKLNTLMIIIIKYEKKILIIYMQYILYLHIFIINKIK